MKIVKKSTVNQNKGRSGQVPVMIVCHRTCGSFDGAVSWLQNPESKASSHFVVAKDGKVVQLVDIEDTAWCNGTSSNSSSSKYYKNSKLNLVRNTSVNANTYTISIEFEGLSDENGELTEKQFNVAVELVKFIIDEVKRLYDYDLKADAETLVGHCDITPKWKPNCPGENFPIKCLVEKANEGEHMLEKRNFIINGSKEEFECIVDKGVTYIPVRKIAEQLNAKVSYDSSSKTTTILTK